MSTIYSGNAQTANLCLGEKWQGPQDFTEIALGKMVVCMAPRVEEY